MGSQLGREARGANAEPDDPSERVSAFERAMIEAIEQADVVTGAASPAGALPARALRPIDVSSNCMKREGLIPKAWIVGPWSPASFESATAATAGSGTHTRTRSRHGRSGTRRGHRVLNRPFAGAWAELPAGGRFS